MEESKPFVKWLPGKIIKVAKGFSAVFGLFIS